MHTGEITVAKKRQKLKRAAVLVSIQGGIHDRRTSDTLMNSKVAAIVVDDPYEPGGKITVIRTLRDDPLAAMHHAKQIDQAQFVAGRHWQRAFEVAQGQGYKAIDTTKEAVDGGQIAKATITDKQISAFGDLKRATQALGMEGESIVIDVLGRGLTLAVAAAKRGLITEAWRKYFGIRLRECLDTLAHTFGYAGQPAATRC